MTTSFVRARFPQVLEEPQPPAPASVTRFHGYGVPEPMRRQILRWVDHGARPDDDVLEAVIRNDLRAAFACAGAEDWAGLYETLRWLSAEAPSVCWGSQAALEGWVKLHRDVALAAVPDDDDA